MRQITYAQKQMILAALGFAVANAVVKSVTVVSTLQIVWVRSIVMLLMTSLALHQQKHFPRGAHRKLLVIRGIAGTFGMYLFFWTLTQMPLATAQIVQYSSPVFTVLFASLFFTEKVRFQDWAALSLCFIGVLLMKGWNSNVPLLAIGAGVLSAILSGVSYNLIRKTEKTDPPLVVVFYFALVSVILVTPPTIFVWVWPSPKDWFALITVGILTQFSQIALTKAYHHGSAAEVSNFINIGAILAAALGYIFFGEIIGIVSFVGIIFILGGVALSKKKS